MSAPSGTRPGPGSQEKTGVYVYGILPEGVELTGEIDGVGNPPGQARLVRFGEVAALVSDVDLSQSLGSPHDLQTHQEILDSTVTRSSVVPLRFGAVLTSEDAVVEELLEPCHDEFAIALAELEGRAEYLVEGRYVETAILNEVLSAAPEAADLREQVPGKDPAARRDLRIRLGELISKVIAVGREEDTRLLLACAGGRAVASGQRELDPVYVAFLVEEDEADELERAVQEVARGWEGRVELGVRGPIAPWDFV
jgi:hypothetical protein